MAVGNCERSLAVMASGFSNDSFHCARCVDMAAVDAAMADRFCDNRDDAKTAALAAVTRYDRAECSSRANVLPFGDRAIESDAFFRCAPLTCFATWSANASCCDSIFFVDDG